MKTTRNTPNSMTAKIINKHGLDHIKALWTKYGMYQTAKRLGGTSPYVIRWIASKHGWKRPASTCPHLVAGVQNGRMDASYYKTLDFSEVKTDIESSVDEANGKS